MSEQEIIQKYFSKHQESCETVDVSIGDDAAVVSPPKDTKLALTTDTLNAGIHFYQNCDPTFIGYKSLAVSLSDIASMGAKPLWATLNLSLPEISHKWLKGFSDGLYALADSCQLKIIGGDLVKGPLSITMQVIGSLPKNKRLLRSACQVGDFIYVTGTIGDAAAGLELVKSGLNEKTIDVDESYLLNRLHKPTPRLDISAHIVNYAHAAIDISDGFLVDLQRMLSLSGKAAEIELTDIPISDALRSKVKYHEYINKILAGGEDYELIFTIKPQDKVKLEKYAQVENILVTKVGTITEGTGVKLFQQGKLAELPNNTGFDHF